MFTKLKQFKDMRSKAKELESKLSGESVTARAAGDKVVLTLNGNLKMTGLAIDDEMLSAEKKDKLQETIKEAHDDAMKKMQRIMAMKIKEMGGLPKL